MDKEQKAAGIDRLYILKEVNTIDALAQGNVLRWQEVLRLPYNVVYLKLLKNKLDNDFQERYKKILENKAKANAK